MAINTHGHQIQLDKLTEAARNTHNWQWSSSLSTDVYYDCGTGEVWTVDRVGSGYIRYNNPQVICICNTTRHMTRQAIADAIALRVVDAVPRAELDRAGQAQLAEWAARLL